MVNRKYKKKRSHRKMEEEEKKEEKENVFHIRPMHIITLSYVDNLKWYCYVYDMHLFLFHNSKLNKPDQVIYVIDTEQFFLKLIGRIINYQANTSDDWFGHMSIVPNLDYFIDNEMFRLHDITARLVQIRNLIFPPRHIELKFKRFLKHEQRFNQIFRHSQYFGSTKDLVIYDIVRYVYTFTHSVRISERIRNRRSELLGAIPVK